MSDIIRGGQRGALFPVLDPRLRAITDQALAEREARDKWNEMLVGKTSMGAGPDPAPQFYANPNSGGYGTQYPPHAPDASAAKRTMDHITAEERAAVDMTGDSGPALSPFRGIAPKYSLERQEQSLQSAADRSQAELGDMLAEQQDIQVPPPPSDYTSTGGPAIDESKFADMFKRQYLARQNRLDLDRMADEVTGGPPMDTTGRGGPFADLPSPQELMAGMGRAARGDRPRIEDRDMTPEELAATGFTVPRPPKPAPRPVSDKEILDARAAETAEADKRRGVRPQPKPQQPKPQLNAGPEELRPGPDDVAAPAPAPAAREPKAPVPRNPKLRDSYIRTIWPQIKQFAAGRGVNENALRDVYETAASEGGHAAGVRAMKEVIADLRADTAASAEMRRRESLIEDGQARRMGVSPQAYQNYRSMRQDPNIDDLTAHLAMLHGQYPAMGYGNLLAMHMRNQAGIQQANNLQGENQNQLPAVRAQQNLGAITGAGPGPATMPALREHWRQTEAGRANPNGADRFAQEQGLNMYKPLHGREDLTPEQAAFANQYIRTFRTFAEFRAFTGIEDTPENRKLWADKTGKPSETISERLGNAWNSATSAVQQAVGAVTNPKPKPPANNVAKGDKPKKPRRDGGFKE